MGWNSVLLKDCRCQVKLKYGRFPNSVVYTHDTRSNCSKVKQSNAYTLQFLIFFWLAFDQLNK